MKRKTIFILILFFFYNISLLFFTPNETFINTLYTPITISYKIYILLWIINSVFMVISFYKLFINYDINDNYIFVLLLNYISTECFGLTFFYLKSFIISIILLTITLVSIIILYYEHKKIDKYSSIYLMYPVIFYIFIFLSFTTLYLNN